MNYLIAWVDEIELGNATKRVDRFETFLYSDLGKEAFKIAKNRLEQLKNKERCYPANLTQILDSTEAHYLENDGLIIPEITISPDFDAKLITDIEMEYVSQTLDNGMIDHTIVDTVEEANTFCVYVRNIMGGAICVAELKDKQIGESLCSLLNNLLKAANYNPAPFTGEFVYLRSISLYLNMNTKMLHSLEPNHKPTELFGIWAASSGLFKRLSDEDWDIVKLLIPNINEYQGCLIASLLEWERKEPKHHINPSEAKALLINGINANIYAHDLRNDTMFLIDEKEVVNGDYTTKIDTLFNSGDFAFLKEG